ncbi:MAG: TlpA family protein disulfide reductase [Bauldia sp.]|nr:TlpA family protein disulfide reductase [Bauldia sp.]
MPVGPTRRRSLIGLGALAIVAVGAVAVYVSLDAAGNQASAACAAAVTKADAVEPFAVGELAAFRTVTRAIDASALSFERPDGSPVAMADFAGKTILLNLWATWCAPCLAEMPALAALQAEAGSDAFEVVTVNMDPNNRPADWLAQNDVALPLYVDPRLSLLNDTRTFGTVGGLPTTFLIDEDNCLIGLIEGPAEWNGRDAHRLINAALDES